MNDPTAFDSMLRSKTRMKLLSICLGPFKADPSRFTVNLKLRDFINKDLFHILNGIKIRRAVLRSKVCD